MQGVELILAATALIALSGLPSLAARRDGNAGQWISAGLSVLGSAAGLGGVIEVWRGAPRAYSAAMSIPGGSFSVVADDLSLFFLVPIFLISALGSIYGLQYWKQSDHPASGRKLRIFFGLLSAAMALVVVARNGVLLLMAWEIMALSGFFTLTAEDDDPEVRQAGWIYLAASHLSALLLLGMVVLYGTVAGTLELAPLRGADLGSAAAGGIFLLGLAAFGIKAGLFPLHVWLPAAHANAPSHVSALFSGVMIKLGVYGVARVCWMFPHPPLWWGELLLILGAVSGVVGVLFAIGQHDLKRLLAYHSIENIGIIFLGLGVAMVGRSLGQPAWVALGLGGALLHVWNHSLFKSLLFLSAGSVIHASHTREIDQMGGLAKTMPWTALAFLVGAVAICGLPPLNGFVSELLIYLGSFRSLQTTQAPLAVTVALCVTSLALIGGLAIACFVKVYGIAFLGEARRAQPVKARESGPLMLAPLGVLALGCIWIGLFPASVASLLDRVIGDWLPGAQAPLLETLAPFWWISAVGLALAISCVALWRFLRARLSRTESPVVTWDCGYGSPNPRMQYTASSFAQMIVTLFGWLLLPRSSATRCKDLFPKSMAFHTQVPDTVLDQGVLPAFRGLAGVLGKLRVLQQGKIQHYILYILIVLLFLYLVM